MLYQRDKWLSGMRLRWSHFLKYEIWWRNIDLYLYKIMLPFKYIWSINITIVILDKNKIADCLFLVKNLITSERSTQRIPIGSFFGGTPFCLGEWVTDGITRRFGDGFLAVWRCRRSKSVPLTVMRRCSAVSAVTSLRLGYVVYIAVTCAGFVQFCIWQPHYFVSVLIFFLFSCCLRC